MWTAPYAHTDNGVCERGIKVIGATLKTMLLEYDNDQGQIFCADLEYSGEPSNAVNSLLLESWATTLLPTLVLIDQAATSLS